MNRNKIYKQIMLFVLVFWILMAPMEVFSLDETSEFSDKKEKIIANFRVLVGYNATLINKSDITFKCWVILEDHGKYDVFWKNVKINSTIRDNKGYETNTAEVKLEKNVKILRILTIQTPYDDLTEKDLKLQITFSFYETSDDKETHEVILKKNMDGFLSNTFFIGFIIPFVMLGLIKRSRRS